MGWANCGEDSKGRPIGYNHEGTCDHPGCGEDTFSCEGYFCEDHHNNAVLWQESYFYICDQCAKLLLETGEWKLDEEENVIVEVEV